MGLMFLTIRGKYRNAAKNSPHNVTRSHKGEK